MSAPRTGRRLAAIMFADVVGYSSLVGRDEEGTLARLRKLRQTIIDPAVEEVGGRVVKTSGDGFLIEFPSAVDAVRSAIAVQRAIAALPTAPHEEALQLRIGVNLGDVVVDGDDLLGDGVNIASRLQTMADPGAICISAKVREEIVGRIDLALNDLGAQKLKNITQPVRVYSIDLSTPASAADDRTRMSGAAEETVAPQAAEPSRGPTPLAPGELLSHTYRIERLVGTGAMGAVYRAQNVLTNDWHAVKIILPELTGSQQVVDLFRREAAVLKRVRHPATVGYEGVFRDQHGRVYLVMEFVEGRSLAIIMKERPLTVAETRTLAERILTGLGAAHATGAVHRDLSPDNIILPGDKVENAKIIDFGIAKGGDLAQRSIIGSEFAGKYSYASPEQAGLFGGQVDQRSDIYSLGLVLAAAARGRALEMGTSLATVVERRRSVPDLASLPPELRDYLSLLLQPNPADRPQNAREAIERLHQPAARAVPARPEPVTPVAAPKAPAKPAFMPWIAAAALAGALVLAGGLYFIFGGGEDASAPVDLARRPVELKPAIEAAFAELPCARLGASVADGAVTLVGHLRDQGDLDRLGEKLRAIPGLRSVDGAAVQQLDQRRCAYLAQLEEAGAVLSVKHGQGSVAIGQPPPLVKQFMQGAMLNIEIPARSDLRYHYVSLLDADNRVLHLLPTPTLRDNWVDERLLRGLADKYRAAEPAGLNLLLDVSSSAALAVTPPPGDATIEFYSDYMRRLVAAVRAAPRGTVEYSYVLVDTTQR